MAHPCRIIVALLLLIASAAALAAAAKGAQDYYWLLLIKPPNKPPVIAPEVGVTFRWPSDSVRLDAVVSDYPGDTLVYEWTQLSGPAGVQAEFIDAAAEDITAVFPRYGDYLLQLSVSDGEFTTTVEVAVTFDFLRNYTNPDQLKLPPERVYPMGQKMMISAWDVNPKAYLGNDQYVEQTLKAGKAIASAGFSAFGPNFNTIVEKIGPFYDEAKKYGLRAAHRIVNDASNSSELCDPDLDMDVVRANIRESFNAALREWSDQIDIWLTGTEELWTNLDMCSGKIFDYLESFRAIAHELDPEKRPIWISDVTGVTYVDAFDRKLVEYPDEVKQIYYATLDRYFANFDMVGPQMYVERIPSTYLHNAVINELVGEAVATAKRYKIPVTVSFGAHYEPVTERESAALINKVIEHDLYLALNNGLQGFQVYEWNFYNHDCIQGGIEETDDPNVNVGDVADCQTWQEYTIAWHEHVKRFTDNGLDYAYLWGERRDDLTLEILSGPERIQWEERGEFFDFPTISTQNIQYGDNRFLIVTNSADSDGQDVAVRVGNIPERCTSVLDIREGLYLPKGSTFTTTLPPLGVKLYRFDKDGDC